MEGYTIWKLNDFYDFYKLENLLQKYVFFRKIIKKSTNYEILILNNGIYLPVKINEFSKKFLNFCIDKNFKVQNINSIYSGLSRLLSKLIMKKTTNMFEPPIKYYHPIAHLSNLINISFKYSQFVLYLVSKLMYQINTIKNFFPHDLICESESINEITKYDYIRIGEYFDKYKNISTRLSILIGYSLKKILEKYVDFNNWIIIDNFEDFEDKIKNPYLKILLTLL